ncbi:MAG: aerotolerance regulator BatA [Halobacteriovorax sp.]|nr:aerotolerance regulator BatA [Halobacteriovorax sp.]
MIENTTYVWALLAGVAAIVWLYAQFYPAKKPIVPAIKQRASVKIRLLKMLMVSVGFIGWGFIIFSMTLPKKPAGFITDPEEVNDVIFVVDVSLSMMADDFRPNRLEVSKNKILEFVSLRPTDRIAIVMFSEKVFTLLPLTTDLDLVKRAISDIRTGFLGSGTNIGDALALGVARGLQSLAKNKVIILLTDGVSNVGTMTPIQAAEEAKAAGIKVYAIAIGGNGDARIPVPGGFGTQRFQYIPGGSFDVDTLKKIATMTGGEVFRADNEEALKDVLAKINELERTKIEKSGRAIFEELYWEPLAIGSLLLALSFLGRWAGLREVV